MNIDRSRDEFRRKDATGKGPMGRAWDGVKRWSGANPRLSRVVWFGVGLALLCTLIVIQSERDVKEFFGTE